MNSDNLRGTFLKFSPEGVYNQTSSRLKGIMKYIEYPVFESSRIIPTDYDRYLQKGSELNSFLAGRDYLHRFQFSSSPVSSLLDTKSLAKHYAISEIGAASNGLNWYNMTFHFNTEMNLLQPVATQCYDGNEDGIYTFPIDLLMMFENETDTLRNRFDFMFKNAFNEQEFVDTYISFLKKFSDNSYLDSLMQSNIGMIDSLERWIQKENRHYSYDRNLIKTNAAKIRAKLKYHVENISLGKYPKYVYFHIPDTSNCSSLIPLKYAGLNVYLNGINTDSSKYMLEFENFHCDELTIVGYGKENNLFVPINPTIQIPFSSAIPGKIKSQISKINKLHVLEDIYFSNGSSDSILTTKVLPWPAPM